VFAVLLIAGCKTAPDINPIIPVNDCSTNGQGKQHHDTPVVCVDGTGTLSVNPESIRVFDVMSTDRRTPPTIQWITRPGGGNLRIEMKDPGCVETPIDCNGHGHCGAKVISGVGAGAKEGEVIKTCRYTVTLDGRVLDPDAVIISCCTDQ
jgi:hypothetical protein